MKSLSLSVVSDKVMRMEGTEIFNDFSFKKVPFVGLGNAKRMKLLQHPYLTDAKPSVYKSINPWNKEEGTMVGLSKNKQVFALLSIDSKAAYVNKPLFDVFHTTIRKYSTTHYGIDIHSTDDYLVPKEVCVEAFPQIFSAIPLDITYNILIDKLITNVPNNNGGNLMMKGTTNRMMNGQIFIPAGEIVDLGPILKMIRRKKAPGFNRDNHLITRHVHLDIRKRLYG